MAQEAETTPAEGQEPKASESKEGQEPKAEPKGEAKTFDEGYVKKLRDEAAKYRTEAQEAKARAEQYEEQNQSELEKASTRLQRAEKAKTEAEAKLLRYEVAHEKEVPAKLVPLLTAASKEDLEAQADLILENAKPAETPEFDGGAREPAPEPKTPEEAHNDFLVGLFKGQKPN